MKLKKYCLRAKRFNAIILYLYSILFVGRVYLFFCSFVVLFRREFSYIRFRHVSQTNHTHSLPHA